MLYLTFPENLSPEIIPGLPIRWYGLMYVLAFSVAYGLFHLQTKDNKKEFTEEKVSNFFFWGILGLLIGARLFAVTIYDTTGRYISQPWLIFWPFYNGRFVGLSGMSYHGGVVGTVVALLIYCRVKKINFLQWADITAVSIPLGYTFGRLGNFINGELYGRVSSGPLGMIFPHARAFDTSLPYVQEAAANNGIDLAGLSMVNLPRHPSQLYEALFEGIVLFAILWLIRKKKPFHGFMVGSYLIGYGLFRFVIEYFRMPDADLGYIIDLSSNQGSFYFEHALLQISTGQILCLLMIAGGFGLLLFCKIWAKRPESLPKIPTPSPVNSRKRRKKIK